MARQRGRRSGFPCPHSPPCAGESRVKGWGAFAAQRPRLGLRNSGGPSPPETVSPRSALAPFNSGPLGSSEPSGPASGSAVHTHSLFPQPFASRAAGPPLQGLLESGSLGLGTRGSGKGLQRQRGRRSQGLAAGGRTRGRTWGAPHSGPAGRSRSVLEPATLSARAAQYACSLLGHALQRHGASPEVQKQVRQLEGHLSLGRKRK